MLLADTSPPVGVLYRIPQACTITGMALAELCYKTLLADGPAACAAVEVRLLLRAVALVWGAVGWGSWPVGANQPQLIQSSVMQRRGLSYLLPL